MLTFADILRINSRRSPSKVAVIDDHGEQRTFETLASRVWAMSRMLLGCGVEPGDAVGLLSGNSVFAVEAFLAITCAGAVAVQYNSRWATPELVFALNDSMARVLLVESEFVDLVTASRDSGQLELLEQTIVGGPALDETLSSAGDPAAPITPDSPMVIIYTGGTTGFPKGVVLTHQNAMTNALNETIDTNMHPGDVTLLIAPMFHSASLLCWFAPHLLLGATSVLMRAFDEEHAVDLIARHGVTNGFFVPNMIRRLLASGAVEHGRMASLARLYTGGSTWRMPDKDLVRLALPDTEIYYQYGLTEAGPIVTRLLPADMFRTDIDGSIGQEFLLTEATVRSLDPESDEELPSDEVGELCVRGPNVMQGYFRRPDATSAALRGGWLRTGDLGTRDADGYFFFRDRAKDMIKSGGENVYSAEVEQVFYSHPSIAEAAILGYPSAEWDEEVRAVVALRAGRDLTLNELDAYLRRHLAGYKIPKKVALVPLSDIPVSPSGKVLKRSLRDRQLPWTPTSRSTEPN